MNVYSFIGKLPNRLFYQTSPYIQKQFGIFNFDLVHSENLACKLPLKLNAAIRRTYTAQSSKKFTTKGKRFPDKIRNRVEVAVTKETIHSLLAAVYYFGVLLANVIHSGIFHQKPFARGKIQSNIYPSNEFRT